MSQAEQAQKGFKTFILTLSISLIVFSAVYYIITNGAVTSSTPDIESQDKVTENTEGDTVFGKLASQKIDTQSQAVLAATSDNTNTDETYYLADSGNVNTNATALTASTTKEPTQASGTPNGGVTSITMGLIVSTAIFLFGMYVIAKDPRRLAIKGFEKRVTQDLD